MTEPTENNNQPTLNGLTFDEALQSGRIPTAYELRRRVEAKPSYRLYVIARYLSLRPLRRFPPPSPVPGMVTAALLVMALSAGAIWLLSARPVAPPFAGSVPRPGVLQLPAATTHYEAEQQLQALAEKLRNSKDPATGKGVQVQIWDISLQDPDTGYTARDEYTISLDNTHTLTTITLLPSQRPGSVSTRWTTVLPSHPASTQITMPTELPFPTDPAEAAVKLSHTGGEHLLQGVAHAYRRQYIAPAQRVAMLRALASTEIVVAHGQAYDRAGRHGLAFTAEVFGVRDLIFIDAETGALLSHEQVATQEGQAPMMLSYLLVLD